MSGELLFYRQDYEVLYRCRLCPQRLKPNGGVLAAHGKTHVRAGDAVEIGDSTRMAETRFYLAAAATKTHDGDTP